MEKVKIYNLASEDSDNCVLVKYRKTTFLFNTGVTRKNINASLHSIANSISDFLPIDYVFITSSSFNFAGGFPHIFKHILNDNVRVFTTSYIKKQLRIELFEYYEYKFWHRINSDGITFNDIDNCIDSIEELVVGEELVLNSNEAKFKISLLNSGLYLGSFLIHISYLDHLKLDCKHTLLYASEFSSNKGRLISPSNIFFDSKYTTNIDLFITNKDFLYKGSYNRQQNEEVVLNLIIDTFSKKGATLFPIDLDYTLIELLMLLDSTRKKYADFNKIPIFVVSKLVKSTIKLLQTSLEWSSNDIQNFYDEHNINPFKLDFFKVITSVSDLKKVMNIPCVIIATNSELKEGFSEDSLPLFIEQKNNSLILFKKQYLENGKLMEGLKELFKKYKNIIKLDKFKIPRTHTVDLSVYQPIEISKEEHMEESNVPGDFLSLIKGDYKDSINKMEPENSFKIHKELQNRKNINEDRIKKTKVSFNNKENFDHLTANLIRPKNDAYGLNVDVLNTYDSFKSYKTKTSTMSNDTILSDSKNMDLNNRPFDIAKINVSRKLLCDVIVIDFIVPSDKTKFAKLIKTIKPKQLLFLGKDSVKDSGFSLKHECLNKHEKPELELEPLVIKLKKNNMLSLSFDYLGSRVERDKAVDFVFSIDKEGKTKYIENEFVVDNTGEHADDPYYYIGPNNISKMFTLAEKSEMPVQYKGSSLVLFDNVVMKKTAAKELELICRPEDTILMVKEMMNKYYKKI